MREKQQDGDRASKTASRAAGNDVFEFSSMNSLLRSTKELDPFLTIPPPIHTKPPPPPPPPIFSAVSLTSPLSPKPSSPHVPTPFGNTPTQSPPSSPLIPAPETSHQVLSLEIARLPACQTPLDQSPPMLSPAPSAASPDSSPRGPIFLGGSCGETTWRTDIAIPMFEKNGIDFFNPQVANWVPEMIDIEARAKASARRLLFVIDSQTRALAAMIEATELIVMKRQIALVIVPLPQGLVISGDVIPPREFADLKRARQYLRDVANRHNVHVFDDIVKATEWIVSEECRERGRLPRGMSPPCSCSSSSSASSCFRSCPATTLSSSSLSLSSSSSSSVMSPLPSPIDLKRAASSAAVSAAEDRKRTD